jgi:hypothetical protein
MKVKFLKTKYAPLGIEIGEKYDEIITSPLNLLL